jgi:hypothetical protein
MDDLFTVVMNTYLNNDFTFASTFALREHFPTVKLIYANGHGGSKFPKDDNSQIITIHNAAAETLRNRCVERVFTPYVLIMDNDTKILSKDAITSCIETISSDPLCVQTGAYGMKVVDWNKRIAYVGTEFTAHMELDASPGYFSFYRTEAYKLAGGMDLNNWFYSTFKAPPEAKGSSGDLAITTKFKQLGFKCLSPRERLPVIHWGGAVRWMNRELPSEKQWYTTNTHIRCNPLNNWERENAKRLIG